jgi:PhoH-like ATPase
MKKHYVVDTNVLIDSPHAIESLRNGKDGGDTNEVYLLETVLNEVDGLKRKTTLKSIVQKVVANLHSLADEINYFENETVSTNISENPDDRILAGVLMAEEEYDAPMILLTNDRVLQLKANFLGIQVEEFKDSIPFNNEEDINTGFVESKDDFKYVNTFCFDNGILLFNGKDEIKPIGYENKVWATKPKHYTQNAAFELLLNDTIDLVTLSASAGMGKTHCAVASALDAVLQKKKYEKIYIFKSIEDVGPSIGFLPGTMEEKIDPYMRYIKSMFFKLHNMRKGNGKVFLDDKTLNPEFVEILPLTYIRGMNIDNAFVIIDEAQNISRLNMRSLLTRMGDNVKCVVCGDPNQVDNPNLSKENNGLNWCVKLFSGADNYGHIQLGGKKSRGPICDLVLEKKL